MEVATVVENGKIRINKFINFTLNEEKFAANGEVTVDFDDTVLTRGEASEIVNDFFVSLIKYNNTKSNVS